MNLDREEKLRLYPLRVTEVFSFDSSETYGVFTLLYDKSRALGHLLLEGAMKKLMMIAIAAVLMMAPLAADARVGVVVAPSFGWGYGPYWGPYLGSAVAKPWTNPMHRRIQ